MIHILNIIFLLFINMIYFYINNFYPKLSGMDHDPVLVQPGLDASDININQQSIRRVNAFCGHDNQIHVFVLLFKASEGIEIAYRQRSYWKGFNKNEFVVCLGMDGNSVKWCQPMSWTSPL